MRREIHGLLCHLHVLARYLCGSFLIVSYRRAVALVLCPNRRICHLFRIPSVCLCEISGVGDLRWFASGGSNCSDPVVEEVLKAESLAKLAIVYPDAGVFLAVAVVP